MKNIDKKRNNLARKKADKMNLHKWWKREEKKIRLKKTVIWREKWKNVKEKLEKESIQQKK